MTLKSKILTILLVNTAVVCLALVLIEIYLVQTDQPPQVVWGWRDTAERPNEQNQLGFRGQPIDYRNEDFVILLVGDSQVQAEACAYDVMPEKRLEYHLSEITQKPIKVFSIGAAGYGQDQQLLGIKEYLANNSANLILVWETPENDIWNNMFPTHWPTDGQPKPTFWLNKNGQLNGPNQPWGSSVYSSIRTIALIEQYWQSSLDVSWEHQYFPPRYPLQDNYQGEVITDWYILDSALENIENGKTHVGLSVIPASERIGYGIQLTHQLFQQMEQLATNHLAQFWTFYVKRPDFPLKSGTYSVKRGSETRFVQLSEEQYWQNLQKMNHQLNFFSIPVSSATPFTVNSYDPHLNPAAVDQVMKEVAEVLAKRLLLSGNES